MGLEKDTESLSGSLKELGNKREQRNEIQGQKESFVVVAVRLGVMSACSRGMIQ